MFSCVILSEALVLSEAKELSAFTTEHLNYEILRFAQDDNGTRDGNKCQKELVSIEGKDRHTIANRHSDGAVRARGVADTCV